MANTRVYYGLYDGQVCNVKDPENRGRIQCIIPEVTGEYPSAWCEPCVPCASDDNGDFYLPNLKEYVWVMFEHGNPNKPVYLGSWYAQNRTPLKSDYSENKLNQRIIGFFSSFIRMFKNEKKIEIGVTKNDPEIVIEEGKVSLKGLEGSKVDDVKVNGTSVVQDKVADVTVPTKTSELDNDSDFVSETEVNERLQGKSDKNHSHDDRYYTESEMDSMLESKVDNSVVEYNHNSFTFSSGFSAYSTGGKTDGNCPYALKTGKVVNISGAIKPTTARTTTAEVVIGKVPVGCEPMREQHILQQGSGQNKYLLVIRTNGNITASRYGLSTDTPLPSGVWLNISCSYICA